MLRRSLLFACLALPACATAGDSSAGNHPPIQLVNDAGSKGGNGDSGSSLPNPTGDDDASTGDDDASPSGDDSGAAAVALPFYVSDQFYPSGFMGDSQASMTAITMGHDASSCKSPRQTGAAGDCYSISWAPTPPDGGSSWAGVYWQSPANNWGAKPGKSIAPNATKVSFLAAGKVGGEVIQACAGGMNMNGSNPSLPNSDSFSVKSPTITLTTSWTRYEISLQGASYTDVLGGFCWVAAATTPGTIAFYIDDVRWE